MSIKRYIVVYQMGKVASTSIVATLDDLEDVEAVQSHFLGEKALAAIIPTITAANVPHYFFKHQLGQFIENVRITRRVNRIRAGLARAEQLLVISLARDPVEWVRSSVVQDAAGYLPILEAVCRQQSLPNETPDEAVMNGLSFLLNAQCDVLQARGGIDKFLDGLQTERDWDKGTIFNNNPGASRVFMMCLRPADWFERHFKVALGIHPTDMAEVDGVWVASSDHSKFVVARYEEMSTTLIKWLEREDICSIPSFKRENISGSKDFSGVISEVFSGGVGNRLRSMYSETRYCRQFGYSAV